MLVGAFGGVALSAVLDGFGLMNLDALPAVAVHYAGAVGLALLLGVGLRARREPGRLRAAVVVAALLTFAVRRWLTTWVNLEPFDLRSGPAGHATAIVFPLEGLILGAVIAASQRSDLPRG